MVSGKRELVRRYFDLVAKFHNDPKEYETILHPEMLETEYPNLLSPVIRTRNSEDGLKGIEMGRQILKFQKYDIQNFLESAEGKAATAEVIWSGEVAVNLGPLKVDQELRAYICFVFEFQDGLILRQRHYDCFEPIQS